MSNKIRNGEREASERTTLVIQQVVCPAFDKLYNNWKRLKIDRIINKLGNPQDLKTGFKTVNDRITDVAKIVGYDERRG